SLNGLGPARKWVAIGARLLVLLLFILIIGGVRWQRQNQDVEVMVLRDISQSTAQVRDYPGQNLQRSLDEHLMQVAEQNKRPRDRVGVISFHSASLVDAMPNTKLVLDSNAKREPGTGTDVASAIQLALATLSQDALHRLVLVWDGNQTLGNLDEAVAAAASKKIQIDVVPLAYDVRNEVLLDRIVSPTWKREGEPFTIDVILRSTNALPVTGKLTVTHNGDSMDLDPRTPDIQATIDKTLQPGLNVERVFVPPLMNPGVHQFRAHFEAPNVSAEVGGKNASANVVGDTLVQNNGADTFTFVRGKGQVLYVDNYEQGSGKFLRDALAKEGIEIRDENHVGVDQFPTSLIQLQNYDAIILANVPRGAGGMSEDQQKMLATYVHDMGGGLLMIGGPDTFGAGGWQGSKLEEVLPVNMDIPAQRQMPKGALVLVMHSCEMPDGNYWGEQCALKAIETLSERDEVGVITYGWGAGGSRWEYPLSDKGDGSKVVAAVKKMQVGDMPSFDDSLNVALNGTAGQGGLLQSNARQKHIIIVSDGDPSPPNQQLVQQFLNAKVSVSTVTVYPHAGDPDGLPPAMKSIANQLKGRAYGPINQDPNQLPQIFIKEATVVRRSLIHEELKGIPLNLTPSSSETIKGLDSFPPVTGLVLTSRKQNPQIEVPIVAGTKNADPILAHWQSGLGRAAVFTSDARNKWAASWMGSPTYEKFWAQVVRAVARPPMSADFDVQTVQTGDKGKVTVEALDKNNAFLNFLSIRGSIVGPDMKPVDVRLVQIGPGTYSAEFDTPAPGNYVVVLNYRGQKDQGGVLLSGLAMNASPELRDLRSNDAMLRQVAQRTNGKFFDQPFDVASADFFRLDGLHQTASPLPVWDLLLPFLLALIIIDVAVRRIAWDWNSTRKLALAAADRVRAFTTTRKIETTSTVDALRKVREESSRPSSDAPPQPPARPGDASRGSPVAVPNPKAKFEAKSGVEGDISQVVGGASNKPVPSAPKKIEPKGAPVGSMGGLMEAKRRAQQKIREKEEQG
ncbi:MAG: glutamine amidotransferase, partial [Tepidisphaeraceae bacterium]